MAIAFVTPAFERSRAVVLDRGTKVVLRLVPELKKSEGEAMQFGVLLTLCCAIFIASMLGLLVINTALNQDAFVLQRLKHQMNVVNDQRDALLRSTALKASPDQLAAAAAKMGMVPAGTPEFIVLGGAAK